MTKPNAPFAEPRARVAEIPATNRTELKTPPTPHATPSVDDPTGWAGKECLVRRNPRGPHEDLARRAGAGDFGRGVDAIKAATEQSLAGAKDPLAVIRSRLGSTATDIRARRRTAA